MSSDQAVEVVLKFEQLINTQKAESVCSLLAEDSVFIDSLGNQVEGPARLRSAWEGYFKMVPDYTISHEEIFANGNIVAMFGMAQGTFAQGGQIKRENFFVLESASEGRKNCRLSGLCRQRTDQSNHAQSQGIGNENISGPQPLSAALCVLFPVTCNLFPTTAYFCHLFLSLGMHKIWL